VAKHVWPTTLTRFCFVFGTDYGDSKFVACLLVSWLWFWLGWIVLGVGVRGAVRKCHCEEFRGPDVQDGDGA
jgi:hypothetical protein